MGKKPAPQAQIIQQTAAPEPAPPVRATSVDVVQAGIDLRRRELMKKNVRSTMLAGDSGAMSPFGRPKSPVDSPYGGGKVGA